MLLKNRHEYLWSRWSPAPHILSFWLVGGEFRRLATSSPGKTPAATIECKNVQVFITLYYVVQFFELYHL